MTNELLTYRRLFVSTRPTRLATLFPVDSHWKATATRILESYSRVWGGAGNILIPCALNGTFHEAHWRLLEVFDPDELGSYGITPVDLRLRDPDQFSLWLESEAARCAQETTMPLDQAREFVSKEENIRNTPAHLQLSPETKHRIIRTFSIGATDGEPRLKPIWGDTPPDTGLTDTLCLDLGSNPSCHLFNASRVDPNIQLMLDARTGRPAPSHEAALNKLQKSAIAIDITETEIAPAMEFLWNNSVDPDARVFERAILRSAGHPSSDEVKWGGNGFLKTCLMPMTMGGCQFYPSSWLPFGLQRPLFVVMGDTADDFCFWLSLDRMTGRSVWAPMAYWNGTGEVETRFCNSLKSHLRSSLLSPQDDTQIILTSISHTSDELGQVLAYIRQAIGDRSRRHADRISSCCGHEVAILEPRRILDQQLADRVFYEAFAKRDLARPLVTPTPTNFTSANTKNFFWHVDIAVEGYAPPVRPTISRLLATQSWSGRFDVRASTDGISYFSHRHGGRMAASQRLDHVLASPSIHLATAHECFTSLLNESGFRLATSSSGQYAEALLEIWSGLDHLADDLMDPKRNKVLEAFLSEKGSDTDPGVFLKPLRRRFLNFENIRHVCGLEDESCRDLIDSYTARGILAAGHCLYCPRCRFAAWYSIEDLGATFKCQRCRRTSPVDHHSWKKPPNQPWLYYELNEVVFQAYKDNLRVPILALARLKKDSKAFDFVVPGDIMKGESVIGDLDIAAIREGRIIIGEAKKSGQLKNKKERTKKLSFLRKVADALSADEVVIATTGPHLGETAKCDARQAFESSRATLSFLEAIGAS